MSGFESPNFTQAPNDYFAMYPEMGEAELRVTGIMIRYTFGYHRDTCKLGLKKLAKLTGLSLNGVRAGAEAAEKRGTFRRTNPNSLGEAEWELVVQPVEGVQPVNMTPSPGEHDPVQPVNDSVPSKEKSKETDKEIPPAAAPRKKDGVDWVLDFGQKPMTIREAFKKYWPFNVNWETKTARQFMEWAVNEKVTAEQLEQAAQTWKSDRRFNWMQPTLQKVYENWPALVGTTPEADKSQVEEKTDFEKRLEARNASK